MPRSDQIPPCPRVVPAAASDCYLVRSYEIELITPLFGGGVETRVNDPSFPIRPTAIRGQLQFWWRATVGAQYEDLHKLRAAQSEVWGDTTQASRVQVRVRDVSASEPKPCARYEKDHPASDKFRSMPTWNEPFKKTALPYALFPFQGKLAETQREIEIEPASCIHKASFHLMLICHKDINFEKHVEPAVWAWVNFGGLGSRTRRGCGAVLCKDLAPKNSDDLKAMWKRYMPTLHQQMVWPTMGAMLFVSTEQPKGVLAWNEVIKPLRDFRQGINLGRNPGQQSNRPGRSRWPEPETIRRITQQRAAQHHRLSNVPDDAFPRAELGLPIVFHFQGQGEPPDTVLYPDRDPKGERRERMASPLILKPLALQNGKAVPLIMRLQTPALTGVDLRRGDTPLDLPPTTVIRDPRLSKYSNSPLRGSPNGSAIEAFLALARSQGFTEVTR